MDDAKRDGVKGHGPLGGLSARYESAKDGAAAIGYDSRGGLSCGTYQISTRTKTMWRFILWCEDRYPEIARELKLFLPGVAALNGAAAKRSRFARIWVEMARNPGLRLAEAEHGFIFATHFQAAHDALSPEVMKRVDDSRVLQEVLWSTAVQHGAAGAAAIFNGAPDEAWFAPDDAYIKFIYGKRARRLGKLTPRERNAVLARYRDEQARALAMLAGGPS